jgi:hypothetical protein
VSSYDIIRHQVAPILNGAKTDCSAIETTTKSVLSTIEEAVTAAGSGNPVAGALTGFGASTTGYLRDALTLAARVVGAGFTATNAYIQADYHMTQNVHRALRGGITTPLEQKLENMR